MNTYQKSYTTFMESVCKQFNCPEAMPALKEGFKAFCEASDYGTTRYVRGYHQGQDGKFYVGDTIECMRGPEEVMRTIREYANQHYEPGFKLNVVDGIYGNEVSITGYPKVVYDAPDSQMPYDKFQILTKHEDVKPRNKAGRGVPTGVNLLKAKPKGYYNLTPTDRHNIRAGRLMDDLNTNLGEDDTPIKTDEELADWLRRSNARRNRLKHMRKSGDSVSTPS